MKTLLKKSYIKNPEKFKQIVWDYTLSPEEFFAILNNKHQRGSFTQDWAIARVLEHAPYYEAISLIPFSTISEHWPVVKAKLFNQEIRKGYEYVLRKYALSASGQSA